ncbi:MAG: phage holin family protein [Candidatus Sericytochromatia bacterium]|nr:phage holin family protein [Candidatus Tanganyikabacteria bacterium]
MLGLVLKAALAAGAFLAAAYLLPGFHVATWVDALKGAVLLGILNAVLRPVLGLLTLPITLLTLGLFSLVLNGLMVVITDALLDGIRVDNFLWSIAAALVISIVNSVGQRFLP